MARGSTRGGPAPGQLSLFDDGAPQPPDDVTPVPPRPTLSGTHLTGRVADSPMMVRERRSPGGTPLHGDDGWRDARFVSRPARRAPAARLPVDAGPSPDLRLDDVIPVYLATLAAQGRSRHTLKSFELDLRLLRGQLGNSTLGAIELRHLRQFIAWVRLTRENAPNSLRRKVATLKSFFGFLYEERYLSTNVADLLPYPEAYLALPEFLEEEAASRLVSAAEGNPFWLALVLLLLDTGLKRDEALALRTADVTPGSGDAPPGYVVVRETDAAKRLRSRQIPLTARLRDALLAYLATCPHRAGEERLFDVSVRGINFIVETCGQRAGIVTAKPRLTPQVLRETFAVARMRQSVREEERYRAQGQRDEALQLLALRHDAELLQLLGLKDDPDTARKYRMLVRA